MEDVCTILDATMQENRALEIACIDKEYGIVFEYTVPETPEQNGIVERAFAKCWENQGQ